MNSGDKDARLQLAYSGRVSMSTLVLCGVRLQALIGKVDIGRGGE